LIRRLGPLSFPGGQTFNALRRLIVSHGTAAAENTTWRHPSTVKVGEPARLGAEFVGYNRRYNVHSDEKEGTWTCATDAHIQLRLSEPVFGRVRLRVGFSAAGLPHGRAQFVTITANGEPIFAGEVEPWTPIEAERSLSVLPATSVLFLRARCRYTVVPKKSGIAGDTRTLGVFLSSILCERAA
jgi:hypothetical protein